MFVCICKAISGEEIIKYSCAYDFIKKTGAGTDCGKCIEYIKKIIKNPQNDNKTIECQCCHSIT